MLKVGVIGCGYWGPNLIRNFNGLPDVELAAICDLDESRLNHVGLLYPNTKKTQDYREILQDPEIDAVVVATTMSTHFPLGKEVLEAGKHLFQSVSAPDQRWQRQVVSVFDHTGHFLAVCITINPRYIYHYPLKLAV